MASYECRESLSKIAVLCRVSFQHFIAFLGKPSRHFSGRPPATVGTPAVFHGLQSMYFLSGKTTPKILSRVSTKLLFAAERGFVQAAVPSHPCIRCAPGQRGLVRQRSRNLDSSITHPLQKSEILNPCRRPIFICLEDVKKGHKVHTF